ncbi:MAG: CaiB/BaiF CoA transferase family protein [Halobacterium sp.]
MADGATGPLDGVRVVEVGTMISGPTAGRLLADFGADVVKVERPDADDHLRQFGPQVEGAGVWWKYLSRNKRCVTLDLRADEGAAVFADLVGEADVLIENFRPGTLERWGLGPDVLHEWNPGLVVLRVSGFGQDGPYAERPGFGTLAEAMSGFAAVNGFADREPLLPPTGLADTIAGVFGALAVGFALVSRRASGDGEVIDTSLIEPMLNVLGPQVLRYDATGETERRTGNQSTSSAPRNVYRTADDEYVALAASAQPLAMRTFDAIGRPDLKDDPRFATNADRLANRDELDDVIAAWMADHTRAEVLTRFEAHDAAIAPVYDVPDILDDDQYRARESVVTVDDPDLGNVRLQNVVPRFEHAETGIDHLGPDRGEHNEAVYGGLLGYDDGRLAELEADGVI